MMLLLKLYIFIEIVFWIVSSISVIIIAKEHNEKEDDWFYLISAEQVSRAIIKLLFFGALWIIVFLNIGLRICINKIINPSVKFNLRTQLLYLIKD